MALVRGWSREPAPPARMIPFSIADCRLQIADSKVHAQALPIILFLLNLLAPVAVVEIPLHGLPKAGLEGVARRPPELGANLRRVDRVAPVVARPIRHERFQVAA